tara:strand:- start:82 stop:453 length:372 start_codon:yes stop_codon:yes gene_type:complete
MPPFWPFKRKSVQESGPVPVDYVREEDTAETMADRSHVDNEGYQAAMSLLDNPHLGAPEQGAAVTQTVMEYGQTSAEQVVSERDPVRYTQSDDSYWYYKNDDGSYQPEPHIKNDDGSFTPYSG